MDSGDLARLPLPLSRVRGCLLGGAVGDALGAGLEFLSLSAIRASYGPDGPSGFVPAWGRRGAITDDTQMSLFTTEGLIRAWVRGDARGLADPVAVVWHAYLRWLHTQGVPWRQAAGRLFSESTPEPDGILVGKSFLFARRSPGSTCLAALASGRAGSVAEPINQSKGCGGVMRVAPAGLVTGPMGGDGFGREGGPLEGIFRFGAELAALTHGHASGYLPAGFLALVIHLIVRHDETLRGALDLATRSLERWPRHEETLAAIEGARQLAETGPPSAEQVESLGAGWTGEEALAIAIYAALAELPVTDRLRLATIHGGDSDSTGAICGNLLGAMYGESALPRDWLAQLEGRETLECLADDLAAELEGRRPRRSEIGESPEFDAWWLLYPGW